MNAWRAASGLAFAVLIGSLASPVLAAGDPQRGEQAHQACLSCHDDSVYLPPKRKVRSLTALRRETQRWGDYYNPRPDKQRIDDLVAYLNQTYYKF